jgi:hypothetical protein
LSLRSPPVRCDAATVGLRATGEFGVIDPQFSSTCHTP